MSSSHRHAATLERQGSGDSSPCDLWLWWDYSSKRKVILWEAIPSSIVDKAMRTPNPGQNQPLHPAPLTDAGMATLPSPQLSNKEVLPGHLRRTQVQVCALLLRHCPTRDCPQDLQAAWHPAPGTMLFLGWSRWNGKRSWGNLGNTQSVQTVQALQFQSFILGGYVTQRAFLRPREAFLRIVGKRPSTSHQLMSRQTRDSAPCPSRAGD